MDFEFKCGNAKVTISDGKKLKFEGDKKDKKHLESLKPLFDAILNADKSGKKNKLDTGRETSLMAKLEQLLMEDGEIFGDELDLGTKFTNSGKTIDKFIEDELKSLEPEKETKAPAKPAVKQQDVEKRQEKEEKPATVAEDLHASHVNQQRPDKRVSARAYNQTIQNQVNKIASRKDELDAQFTQIRPIQRGDTLWKIAIESLGKENPSVKEINDRIAEIALVNTIDDVNNVRIKTIKVPAGTISAASIPTAANPAPTEQPAAVKKSNIPAVQKKSLEDRGFSAGETKQDKGLEYTEWTHTDGTKVYTTEVNGIRVEASDLETLRSYINAATEAAPTSGTEEDADKTERQTKNIANMRERIKLSGGNLDVIKEVIDEIRGAGNVDPAEAQALVQDLILTKDKDVLEYLLFTETGENNAKEFNGSILNNNLTSAKTLASLYSVIRQKENTGIKLTDEEIELKEFLKTNIIGQNLHTVSASTKDGVNIIEKGMVVDQDSGQVCYSATIDGNAYYAFDDKTLDAFAQQMSTAKTLEAKAKVFENFANTKDKCFAKYLGANANALGANQKNVLTLINNNDMYVISSLTYTPQEKDIATFRKSLADRVSQIYTDANGNPANLRYLDCAMSIIGDAEYDKESDEQNAKNNIISTFFLEKTITVGEGPDATEETVYTFNPSRKPVTYEEMRELLPHIDNKHQEAILNSISSIDDLGNGQFTAILEKHAKGLTTVQIQAKYAELFDAANIDVENNLEGAKAQVLKFIDAVGQNIDLIPFDKIQEKFGDVEFVKEHIGVLSKEGSSTLQRKLTILDLDIKGDDTNGYTVDFTISPLHNYESSENKASKVTLKADTKEELMEKVKPYIELQNLLFENYDCPKKSEATKDEKESNIQRLISMIDDENLDKDFKAKIISVAIVNAIYSEALITHIIETKNPDYITEDFLGWNGGHLTDAQMTTLIEYAKDPKLADGTNNPFYLGTAAGNEIRKAIIYKGKKEEVLAIYDSLRLKDQYNVLKEHPEFFDDLNVKLEELINKMSQLPDNKIPDLLLYSDVADVAITNGLTLSKESADILLSKVSHSAAHATLHKTKNQFFSYTKDANGNVTFKKESEEAYAKAMKHEIDNNGTRHAQELNHIKTLATMSPGTIVKTMFYYSQDGRGMLEDYDSELGGPGVKDLMPLIDKVLTFDYKKSSDEYKALKALVDKYKEGGENYDRYKNNNDFKSGDAKAIDQAISAYIKLYSAYILHSKQSG